MVVLGLFFGFSWFFVVFFLGGEGVFIFWGFFLV